MKKKKTQTQTQTKTMSKNKKPLGTPKSRQNATPKNVGNGLWKDVNEPHRNEKLEMKKRARNESGKHDGETGGRRERRQQQISSR